MTKRGYIRTSTDKQLADRQIDQLKALCDEVYIEDSMSATRRDRPAYDAVMTALRRGDVFVVVSLDRAYRSVIDALIELDKLQTRGVEFLSLSQSFDTRTPEGKLLYTVCAALAEWERSILSQRTKDGMAPHNAEAVISASHRIKPSRSGLGKCAAHGTATSELKKPRATIRREHFNIAPRPKTRGFP